MYGDDAFAKTTDRIGVASEAEPTKAIRRRAKFLASLVNQPASHPYQGIHAPDHGQQVPRTDRIGAAVRRSNTRPFHKRKPRVDPAQASDGVSVVGTNR